MTDTKDAQFFTDMVQTPLFDTVFDLKFADIITIDQSDSAVEALRVLCENDILAAPVVNPNGVYIGMVDMMALVNCSLNIFYQTLRPEQTSEEYLAQKRRFRKIRVQDIMERNLFGLKKNMPILEDFSMFHALETLCITGEHRAAIVDPNNFVTSLITQSMLVQWMVDHIGSMPSELRKARTGEIRPWNIVSTISADSPAIDAFRMMQNEYVSSVGVVDSSGKLVDVMSARDLRGLSPDSVTFRFLWNTAAFFKEQVRDRYPKSPSRPVVVNRDGTLEQILRLMVDKEVHRVFVVNKADQRPVDVISMTDCLRFVVDSIKEQNM